MDSRSRMQRAVDPGSSVHPRKSRDAPFCICVFTFSSSPLCFAVWSWEAAGFSSSVYFSVRFSSELEMEPCDCDLYGSYALVLSTDLYCRDRQQPPLYPPSLLYVPSSWLSFVLPHTQSSWSFNLFQSWYDCMINAPVSSVRACALNL